MKKNTIILIIIFAYNLSFGQTTKDHLLKSNYEKICSEYCESANEISLPFNKFNKKVVENILNKKEKKLIEKSKTENRLEIVVDSIYSTFSKKEKERLKLFSMIQPTLIKNSFLKIEEIINTYGFISKSRLEKLSIDYDLPSFSYLEKIEDSKKTDFYKLALNEYEADRINEKELEEIKNWLKK